jgi:hypothetical protein
VTPFAPAVTVLWKLTAVPVVLVKLPVVNPDMAQAWLVAPKSSSTAIRELRRIVTSLL